MYLPLTDPIKIIDIKTHFVVYLFIFKVECYVSNLELMGLICLHGLYIDKIGYFISFCGCKFHGHIQSFHW